LTVNRRRFLQLASGVVASPVSSPGRADAAYPDRVVRLIVPRPAGGVVDVIAREWAENVATSFGATYVENIGGAGGTMGAATLARALPDGYTLLFGTTSELVLNPMIEPVSYDPVASFAPIAIICESVAAIIVHPSLPAANLGELVAYARQHPGTLSYGSAGAGTVSNLAGEQFKRLSGLADITHVPYRGGNPAMTDLIAGHIPIATPMVTESIIALHRQGTIRVLAVASDRRLTAASDMATAAEQGYPDLLARLFVGLFAPAKTPPAAIDKVAAVTQQALQQQALRQSFAAAGFEPAADSSPADAARYLQEEIARWRPLVAAIGLKPD
jgi:tripartite-type tricarboxylate transporter receptor subunit TctC